MIFRIVYNQIFYQFISYLMMLSQAMILEK